MARKKRIVPEEGRISQVADKIKQLRLDKGYSSYETFAFAYSLPTIQYWRMESGTNFTIKSLIRILDIHQITLEEFFQGIH
jgi:hypothetical protein